LNRSEVENRDDHRYPNRTLPCGPIVAGSVVAILPIVIIALIFRRNVISGLTAGAIK
jgi:ABC-type glycerol-3-phosphate transport system permease component